MADELLVRLDIEDRTIRREFEEIISSSKGFKLLNSGEMTRCDVLIHEIKSDIKKEMQLVQELTASGMVGEFFLTAAHTDCGQAVPSSAGGRWNSTWKGTGPSISRWWGRTGGITWSSPARIDRGAAESSSK